MGNHSRIKKIVLSFEVLESRVTPATLVNPTTLTYQDVDGDDVTVKLSRPLLQAATVNAVFHFDRGSVNGNNATPQQLQTIDLTPLAASGISLSVTATPHGRRGDGFANVGYIRTVAGDEFGFDINGIDLDQVTIDGDLGRIDAGGPFGRQQTLAEVVSLFMTPRDQNRDGKLTYGLGELDKEVHDFAEAIAMEDADANHNGSVTAAELRAFLGATVDTNGDGIITDAEKHDLQERDGFVFFVFFNFGTGVNSLTVHSLGRYGTATQESGGNLQSRIRGNLGQLNVESDIVGASVSVFGQSGGRVLSVAFIIRCCERELGLQFETTRADVAGGDIGSIYVGGSIYGSAEDFSDAIEASGDIGSVVVRGDIVGGAGFRSGGIQSFGRIGRLQIDGSIRGGQGFLSGRITAGELGVLTVGRDVVGGAGDRSGMVSILGDADQLSVRGNVRGGAGFGSGMVGARDVDSASIDGDIIGGNGEESGVVSLFSANTLRIGGSVRGGAGARSGRILAFVLDEVKVQGDIRGGSGDFSGSISTSVSLLDGGGGGGGGPAAALASGGDDPDEGAGPPIIHAGIGDLRVKGSLVGGSGTGSGSILHCDLRAIRIGGDIVGGSVSGQASLDRSGYIEACHIGELVVDGSIRAGRNTGTGTLTNSAAVRAHDDIGKIVVHGSVVGNAGVSVRITARGQVQSEPEPTPAPGSAAVKKSTSHSDVVIGELRVDGRVERALIIAGFDLDNPNGDAQIGTIQVDGDWIASSVAAGVDPGVYDGQFGTADDTLLPDRVPDIIARIDRIIIKGQARGTSESGDHYGFVAQEIGSLRIGGKEIPLHRGPGNDNMAVGSTGDLRVLEPTAPWSGPGVDSSVSLVQAFLQRNDFFPRDGRVNYDPNSIFNEVYSPDTAAFLGRIDANHDFYVDTLELGRYLAAQVDLNRDGIISLAEKAAFASSDPSGFRALFPDDAVGPLEP